MGNLWQLKKKTPIFKLASASEVQSMFLTGQQEPLSIASSQVHPPSFHSLTTPLLPCLTPLPPSLSGTSSKWSPLANQSAAESCTAAFSFSFSACSPVCKPSTSQVCVSDPNILSWPHTEQPNKHTHTHTDSIQASSWAVFSNLLYLPKGTEVLCFSVCVRVCTRVTSWSTSWQVSQRYSCILNVVVVSLPVRGSSQQKC